MAFRVGVVGYGLSGSAFHAPIISVVPGLALAAIVTSNPDKVKQRYRDVVTYKSYEQLLQDRSIDVVVVTTPTFTHFEYAQSAIRHGKHVIVEKPFTVTTAEADELIALAHDGGVLLSVYQNRRFDNDFLTVKEIVQTNLLGNLAIFESHMDRFRPIVQDRWKEHNKPGSGTLYDLGSHLIDQALLLFGIPNTVFADVGRQRPGAQTDDYFHMVLGYDTLRVILQSGTLVKQSGPRFTLHGSKGSFTKFGLDPQEDALRSGSQPYIPQWGEESETLYGELVTQLGNISLKGKVATQAGRYQSYYEGIVHALKGEGPAPVLAQEARNVIQVIEWAMESHQQQRTVQITQ